MAATRTASAKAESVKLSKEDWTDTALATLISQGIDAVQITQLAKTLGVSRGSFYWHFEGRQALLESMIEAWRSANGHSVRDVLQDVDSLSEGVLEFFTLWIEGTRFSPELEQVVRDWARLDQSVLKAVRKEDAERIKHIGEHYVRFGFAADEASVRARILYFAQIGYYAMHMRESMQDRNELLELYYISFTGLAIEPEVAVRYKARFEAYS